MGERKTIRKIFYVWEFEKEENWINEMAMQGWALCDVGFCRYTFEKCEPGEYIVRLSFAEGDKQEYINFVESTGAEYAGSFMRWVFFRKKAESGNFELNSDIDSRISMMENVCKMLKALGFANIIIGIANSNITRACNVNLLCAVLLFYALGRIKGKIDELKNLRKFYEN